MKIRNIEFYIKEYELKSGQTVYSPWIKYEEQGLLWGWNKMEHPICYEKDQVWDLDLLSGHADLGHPFYNYSTYDEANKFSEIYSQALNYLLAKSINNQIVSEKIIKQEDMKN